MAILENIDNNDNILIYAPQNEPTEEDFDCCAIF